ncbi:TIGR00289 family protein [Candidatus Pacearchaeota archaeon CG_4_9_14_3_um_filter_31_7]|nr:MAG: TIGR00289 family protein [Candidatus Pacearchaeota archaeon CG1_02_31_27]PIN91861.1 MAG: TIGR00289 family protein [Candidatus Pacearchaeota archaeon CG10_big_fil_rev_8_21_14_0_10_31_59]PIZ80512.1 MAG: TIGR00289 family protein [Candidatus Pacearchaeota archaeon CG_4_10_14_0_2_um_filter_31_10]PJA70595.1 MAG: TIGR00289 family protein [Candidatus Pacearchaeota archaeon CG_4_9_14_3_um_filter_31_7]
MKLAVLFSGGKDSILALYKAKMENEIVCLISIFSENKESYMFHTPNISLVKKQSKALGLPILIQKTKGEKEKELADLEKAIQTAVKKYKIEGVVTGAVASNYQYSRIKNISEKLNLKCINPLWQKDQIDVLKDLLKNNFKAIIVGVFAYPFGKEWLGREIDEKAIKELAELQKKFRINPAGEGGEIETFVLDMPMFKKKLKVINSQIKYENYTGVFEIKKMKLEKK